MMMQKLTSVAATLAFLAARAEAQVTIDPRINSYRCPTTGGNYCLKASLTGGFIVHCKEYIGKPENCRYQLFDLSPRGVKDTASCYQADPAVGDASCALNGTVYPENGEPFAIQDLNTTTTPSATSIPLATLKAEISSDINGPSQPLRECNASETLPEFALEGICNFPTSSRIIPLATLKAEISPDINGPSQPLRECNDSETLPEFALEGICNFPTRLKTRIPPAILKTVISPDINGPSQALRECNDSDILPEFALEGLCNFPDAIYGVSKSSNAKRELAINDASKSSSTKSEGTDNGTSNHEPATTTVALYTGSASKHGVGICVVGAEVLALTLFLLAN